MATVRRTEPETAWSTPLTWIVSGAPPNRSRVLLELEQDHIGVWPDRPEQ
ncbi:hypothetical protein [Actinacidiphila sp. bgisy145]